MIGYVPLLNLYSHGSEREVLLFFLLFLILQCIIQAYITVSTTDPLSQGYFCKSVRTQLKSAYNLENALEGLKSSEGCGWFKSRLI